MRELQILESLNQSFELLRDEGSHSKSTTEKYSFRTKMRNLILKSKPFSIKNAMNKIQHTFALIQPFELSIHERRSNKRPSQRLSNQRRLQQENIKSTLHLPIYILTFIL